MMPVFFFQLPKTAGGSLAASVKASGRYELFTSAEYGHAKPLPTDGKIAWMQGHTTFGLHILYGVPANYITILREPIDRLISDFYFFHTDIDPRWHIPEHQRLSAFVRMVEEAPHLNYCCAMYARYCFEKEQMQGPAMSDPFALLRRRRDERNFVPEKMSFDKLAIDETYRLARHNLSTFSLIGTYERLSQFAATVEQRFRLPFNLSKRVHATPSRPRVIDLPRPIQILLFRKTEADRELYSEFYQSSSSEAINA